MRSAIFATILIGGFWLITSQAGSQTAVVTGQVQVVGNGQVQSEERPITAVTAIGVNGAFELTILVGQPPKLTLTCDANILPIIETSVSNDRLEIFSNRSYSVDRAIMVTVSTPRLASLSASGSNRIDAKDIAGGELSISLDGSNSVVLAGKVSALAAGMNGSNRLSAAQLIAESVRVRVAGSGDAIVDAREHILAEIFGSGSIVVHGNPKGRQSQVNGSGEIKFVK